MIVLIERTEQRRQRGPRRVLQYVQHILGQPGQALGDLTRLVLLLRQPAVDAGPCQVLQNTFSYGTDYVKQTKKHEMWQNTCSMTVIEILEWMFFLRHRRKKIQLNKAA